MNKILLNYTEKGKFTFLPQNSLKDCCDAPNNKSGIYLFYNASGNQRELIYIGCSGHIKNDGTLSTRISGMGGLMGRIVNGHQFDKRQRWLSLPDQMKKDNITKLEIEWYVTYNKHKQHSPIYVESCLLQDYYNTNKKLPKWNSKF